ncbi:DUF5666 domain-containing protein [Vibrio scophthalmi]|uniref:DUF5666 domain-containing protein n=1 Tax=Vibrio scophthalmi LMG 19158 TaxID=870967 RepID=F9RJH4_9VIBR|nr:DUF5666 domain-containing protein [Vibrio scophthalmi]EGU41102.1 hypothetical protein VIS19158_04636 [Vibrio scophthalmi LMG 19158]
MKKLVLVSLLGAVLAGCGGGGGSDDKSDNNNNHRPNAAQGTIERVSGNVITVNGHQYDVASVGYSHVDLSTAQLEPGMLVALTSSPARAVGKHVQLEPTVTGLINITDAATGKFTVNGVELTYADLSPEIQDGDWVMVSSLPTATAGYHVLSVVKFEQPELLGMFEVEGTVTNLTNSTFTLGAALTVDYAGIAVEGGELRNGLWVEVEGEYDSTNNKITATEVEVETYDDIDNDTEIEGLLTWVSSDKSAFELNYRGRFNVTGQTRFEDGNKNHLVQGAMVEVTTGVNNVALEVEFDNDDNNTGDWSDNDIELVGTATIISEDNLSFSVQGKTVFVNRFTEFDDGLRFDTLGTQRVEVEAYKVNGQLIASEIELAD